MQFFDQFKRLSLATKILIVSLLVIAILSVSACFYLSAKLDLINFDRNLSTDTDFGTGFSKIKELDILLLGTDERTEGGGSADFDPTLQELARADACMLLHLNFENNSAQLVSLERALGVPVENAPGGEDWLTHAFAYGGADAMLQSVNHLLDRDVKRYVRVNVGAAGDLIDAIGGVDIELTEIEAAALNGEVYTNSLTKHRVKPGLNHLDGFDAIAYARQRFIDSDFERVQRQRNVLQAAINQTKSLNARELNKLLDEVLPLIQTNLTKNEIMALLSRAPGFLGVQLGQMTMPLHGMYGVKPTIDGRSMMMPDPEEAKRIIDEFFAGTFDPQTYEASDEVQRRVWQAQKQAQEEWQRNQPQQPESQPADSESSLATEEPPLTVEEPLEAEPGLSENPILDENAEDGENPDEQDDEKSKTYTYYVS